MMQQLFCGNQAFFRESSELSFDELKIPKMQNFIQYSFPNQDLLAKAQFN